jgi:hypothetical protein
MSDPTTVKGRASWEDELDDELLDEVDGCLLSSVTDDLLDGIEEEWEPLPRRRRVLLGLLFEKRGQA